jgi:hypothetical protein
MHRQICPTWLLRPSHKLIRPLLSLPRFTAAQGARSAIVLIAGGLILLLSHAGAQADCQNVPRQKQVVTIVPPPGTPPPPVYGFPTPSYRFGWWNTNYWSRKTFHHGFYGDYWQWGYQPGY